MGRRLVARAIGRPRALARRARVAGVTFVPARRGRRRTCTRGGAGDESSAGECCEPGELAFESHGEFDVQTQEAV